MLERQEIEVLLVLADELHFGRTANRLRLTTGRVSQTIKKLERTIGVPLFERTSRHVRLTPLGRQLIDQLRPHVNGIQDAVQGVIDAGRGISGVLRVGFVGAIAGQLLLRAVGAFGSRHPDCVVHILEAQWNDAVARLVDGDVDILFADILAAGHPGLTAGPVLLSEPRMLAVSVDDALAGMESVSVAVLAEHPLIQGPADAPSQYQADRFPRRTPDDRPVRQGPRAGSFGEALTLVAAGRGVLPVGEHAARFYPRLDTAYVPVHDAPPIRWGPIWRSANAGARVRAFVQAAEQPALDHPALTPADSDVPRLAVTGG